MAQYCSAEFLMPFVENPGVMYDQLVFGLHQRIVRHDYFNSLPNLKQETNKKAVVYVFVVVLSFFSGKGRSARNVIVVYQLLCGLALQLENHYYPYKIDFIFLTD
jgi:hypothetical protein